MTLFISIEGGEGSGKSALSAALTERIAARGLDALPTFEPGGTPIGVALRAQLFTLPNASGRTLSPWTETFLFLADRAHHVDTLIRPALQRGAIVLCDRYTDSTHAYQGDGRGLDRDLLQRLNEQATGRLQPDLTLLLDIDAAEGLARTHPDAQDRISSESLAFHQRVVAGFRRLAQEQPQRVHRLDATRPLQEVIESAWTLVEPRLPQVND
jgi:dTMP kinase